jgi:DDE family transposase
VRVDDLAELRAKFHSVWPLLDERTRRLMAASEAQALGYGGVSLVRRACGLSRKAIAKGLREIEAGSAPEEGRIRRPGGGRKPITISDPRLLETLEAMIEDQTRGDPESPLRWICKSTRTIANELGRHHHPVSHVKVAQLLHGLDYSLQSNRKTEEGRDLCVARTGSAANRPGVLVICRRSRGFHGVDATWATRVEPASGRDLRHRTILIAF